MSQPNALSAFLGTFTPSHSLDNDLRALITRHGKEAVRDAVKRLTKGTKGRKQERDWPIIGPEISRKDALDWIEGRDPLKLRSNYSIAQNFARRFPGQSVLSTHRRIMRKLKKQRVWFYEMMAWEMAGTDLPFSQYFDIVSRITQKDERWGRIFTTDYDLKVGMLTRYRDQLGEPEPSMTFANIDKALKDHDAQKLSLGAMVSRVGIFGRNGGSLLSNFLAPIDSDKIAE